MGHVHSVRRVHVEAFQLSVSAAQTSVVLRITPRTFACHSAFAWFLSQYPIGCVQWPKSFFFNRDARKANVQQPFFPNLIGTSSQSDRLYLQFLESFFLYLVQVDRACSVADPSNDVSNDSHLASWFILNGHPHHSRHSEHLSLEGDWDMAVRRLSFQECQPIWDLRMKYDEIFYVLFSI